MKVLLCGGGNAIHVLSSYVSSLDDCEAMVLSLFPGEADRFRDALTEEGIRCMVRPTRCLRRRRRRQRR